MRKRLVIDGLTMLGQVSGVGRYCHAVCSRLPHDQFDTNYYYGYVTRKKFAPGEDSFLSRVKRTATHFRPLASLARACLSRGVHSGDWDLHWQPNFLPVRTLKARAVIATVHDFSWEHFPQFHPDDRVAYLQHHFYPEIASCDRIIVVSQYVKTELLERLPQLEEKVEVIHNGFDSSLYAPSPDVSRSDQYLLSVGSAEPRKNLLTLLEAYALLDPEIRRAYPLLLVGASGWKNSEIHQKIRELGDSVRHVGYVTDAELADYYRQALAFVYPSLYEGFGLPPLEAMACGTPVIVSHASALPEVCGDAAYYVDPQSVEELRAAIEMMVNSKNLRETHSRRGLARAAHFSWDQSAAAHAALFRDVTGR